MTVKVLCHSFFEEIFSCHVERSMKNQSTLSLDVKALKELPRELGHTENRVNVKNCRPLSTYLNC
jgi:hypothetical protein